MKAVITGGTGMLGKKLGKALAARPEFLKIVLFDVADPGARGARIEGLGAGTWYFAVTSYNRVGIESAPAGPVSTTLD